MEVVHAHGIDEWAQLCSESFVPLRTAGDGSFRGSIAHLDLGGIGVSHVASTRSRVFRPAPLIAAEPRDDVLLSIHLTGTGWVEQGGRSARLSPGAAALYEADRPYGLRFEAPMSELVLQVPRDRIQQHDGAIRGLSARTLTRTTPSLEVLRHLLMGIVREGQSTALSERLAETTVDLLTSIIRSPHGDTRARSALSGMAIVAAARAHMERHLDDPRLNVENLAHHLGVSRRYLEQKFALEQESPGEYLRRLRLERARRLLAEPDITVAEVAFATGFSDISTFGRAFKRRYGTTPRDYRRLPR